MASWPRWSSAAILTHASGRTLFGFVDVIAVGDHEVAAVQATSWSNVASRVKKIAEHENLAAVRKSGIRILLAGKRGEALGAA